jgi:hypothetical protein
MYLMQQQRQMHQLQRAQQLLEQQLYAATTVSVTGTAPAVTPYVPGSGKYIAPDYLMVRCTTPPTRKSHARLLPVPLLVPAEGGEAGEGGGSCRLS